MSGILYVIGTPIGNLGDITKRALDTLGSVACVYAEDTRVTHKLFDRFSIKTPLRSYREAATPFQVAKTIQEIIYDLKEGKDLAYVSDAGTPGISDPGNHLVANVAAAGYQVVPIPGPSALAAIISVCGYPAARPLFVGFLPKKKGHQTLMGVLKKALADDVTDCLVFYESPERIVKLLGELIEWGMPLSLCLGRELTKMHEEILRGDVHLIYDILKKRQSIKGEICLTVHQGQS